MARSLQDVLRSVSDTMFPSEPERCANIDSVGYDGDSPLHVAAWRNDLEAVRILIGAGANVNAQGEMDETPLHVAVRQRNVLMMSALLDAGARTDIRSEFGDSPEELARQEGGSTAKLFRQSDDT